MNITLEQLSAGICLQSSAATGVAQLPAELLCAMLDKLSSRHLLQARATSPQFACSVDYLLRCRMLAIVNSKNYEVLWSAHAPLETRLVQRQALQLAHFEPNCTIGGCEVACFKFIADPSLPQFLPLDDEEAFSTNLLSIHLQAVPPPLPSPPPTPEPATSAPLPPFPPSAFTPRKPFFGISLSLGSAQPRLFRSWFEDPSIARAEPSMEGSRMPPSSPRTLECNPSPSSSSSLLSATMLCALVTPSPPPPSSTIRGHYFAAGGRAYTPTPPRLFEFVWEEIKVDVARFVVAAEEGLGWGEAQRRVVVMFRR